MARYGRCIQLAFGFLVNASDEDGDDVTYICSCDGMETGWIGDRNGSNSSGFNALPGGTCGIHGFDELGGKGVFWTSTTQGSSWRGWFCGLTDPFDGVFRTGAYSRAGFSVRCIKDD